uniref:Uncharacterized protein n=1 Tax=Physcomitrium patens TaxID=3218 RepID=A0A2K1K292_PHYPA|nr:hypothetical protein PHYPA_012370 [Physcomitrium patens]
MSDPNYRIQIPETIHRSCQYVQACSSVICSVLQAILTVKPSPISTWCSAQDIHQWGFTWKHSCVFQ